MIEALPFSYRYKDSSHVSEKTIEYIKNDSDLEESLYDLAWAFHSLGQAIPQTTENYWSGHYFPYSESFDEFQISFILCVQGLYKQSMTSLRSVLETGLLSIYYNLDDEGHRTVQGWLQSDDNKEYDTPDGQKIWKIISKHSNIIKYQKKHNIKDEILNLGYLHNYVHSKGWVYSNEFGLCKSNTLEFQEKGFKLWWQSAQKVIKIILILHLLKYPLGIIKYDYSNKFGIDVPSFGGIQSFQVERIKKVLGKSVTETIVNIALEDKNVTDFIKEIKKMPDISEEELKKQNTTIKRIIKKNNAANK